MAEPPLAYHRRRPHRWAVRGPPPGGPGWAGACAERGDRLRPSRLVAVTSGAPRPGDPRAHRDQTRRRPAGRRPRAEHQRLDTAGQPRPGRDGAHARPRRGARPGRGCHHRSPPPGRAIPARAAPGGHDRPRHRRRAAATPSNHGTPPRIRYIRVEGHRGDLTAGDVTGVVVHTDMRRTGSFTCSDDRINALHEAAVWSFRDNACDIPTDCPHRERAAGPATGSCTWPPPRSCTTWPVLGQVAAGRRRGSVGRRDDREHLAVRARRGDREPGQVPQRLGRLGRRDRDRALGGLPRLR